MVTRVGGAKCSRSRARLKAGVFNTKSSGGALAGYFYFAFILLLKLFLLNLLKPAFNLQRIEQCEALTRNHLEQREEKDQQRTRARN